MTLREAAEGIGINFAFLSQIESGSKFPSAETMEALAIFYGEDISKLKELVQQQKAYNALNDDSETLKIARSLMGADQEQIKKIKEILGVS